MKALVVAKTKMGENVCIGAVAVDTRELLRLIPRVGSKYHSWQEFDANIGSFIEVTGTRDRNPAPPHVEDFLVSEWRRIGKRATDLNKWIRTRCHVWKGDRSTVFDGKLRFTPNGKGHLDRGDPLPKHSVGFWELPTKMTLHPGPKPRFEMTGRLPVNAPYVGLESPPSTYPAGSIVRLSLGRWWAPTDGSMPEGCWLQVSGCYLP